MANLVEILDDFVCPESDPTNLRDSFSCIASTQSDVAKTSGRSHDIALVAGFRLVFVSFSMEVSMTVHVSFRANSLRSTAPVRPGMQFCSRRSNPLAHVHAPRWHEPTYGDRGRHAAKCLCDGPAIGIKPAFDLTAPYTVCRTDPRE